MNRLELEEILKDNDSVLNLLNKSQEELTEMFCEDFAIMKDYDQNNPHHCYNLLEHILRTVCALDCRTLNKEDETILRVAAIFHDIGKPSVAFEKNGRTVFYNHAAKSAEIAEKILIDMGFKKEETQKICFFIGHHDDFISFKEKDEMPKKFNPYIKEINEINVAEKIESVQTICKENNLYIPDIKDFSKLLILCMADANAQSEKAYMFGKLSDTRQNKLKRLSDIKNIIDSL